MNIVPLMIFGFVVVASAQDKAVENCGANEVFSSCVNAGCSKMYCYQVGGPTLCVDPFECQGGCMCAGGYLRKKNGTCVLEKECIDEVKCPKDKVLTTCPNSDCRKTYCFQVGKPDTCEDPCVIRCHCPPGLLMAEDGNCVQENECFKYSSASCGPTEVFASCVNYGCRRTHCSQIGQPLNCTVPVSCKGGCLCRWHHLRNDEGNCVPENECSKASKIEGNEEKQSGSTI